MKKFWLVCLAVACFSCSKVEKEGEVFEETMFVMGTVVTISFYDIEEKRAQKLFHDLLTDFKYIQAAWNPWKKGSLARINQLLPMQAPFSVGPELKKMILQAASLSQQTEGYFNPAIGKLVKMWEFHKDELPKGPPPSNDKIQTFLAGKPQMRDLNFSGLDLSTQNKNVLLDMGAFAKGYAVDKAIEYLKSMGVENAIINAGGDLRAIGQKGKKPWVIGIRHPRQQGVLAGIEIKKDESVFTSGDYERFYEYDGKRYHHILNPKTGYPVTGVQSVTVVHKSAAIADAAATALFVAGVKNWERIAKKMQLDQVMLIDEGGVIHLTPKMQKRLSFEQASKLKMQISDKF